jgi:hypothetical protein
MCSVGERKLPMAKFNGMERKEMDYGSQRKEGRRGYSREEWNGAKGDIHTFLMEEKVVDRWM